VTIGASSSGVPPCTITASARVVELLADGGHALLRTTGWSHSSGSSVATARARPQVVAQFVEHALGHVDPPSRAA
jgi:hypothetical protein